MIKHAGLSGDAADAIRANALNSPPENMYDILNLLTDATSHMVLDPGQVVRSQRNIAQITAADAHERYCPVCHKRRG
jgi:predicted Zn-dependent peptidase